MKKHYLILCLALLCGCSSSPEQQGDIDSQKGVFVEKKTNIQEWPFKTIDEGTVKCLEGQYVILLADHGGIYALNGTARQRLDERGWKKLEGEQIVGKDISPILNAGLKLCQ